MFVSASDSANHTSSERPKVLRRNSTSQFGFARLLSPLNEGSLSYSSVQDLKWSHTRQQETLQAMLREEFAMIDDQGPGNQRLYWFPCLADFSAAASAMATA